MLKVVFDTSCAYCTLQSEESFLRLILTCRLAAFLIMRVRKKQTVLKEITCSRVERSRAGPVYRCLDSNPLVVEAARLRKNELLDRVLDIV